MQKRLFNILVIGGVAMLSATPKNLHAQVHAEEGSVVAMITTNGKLYTNVKAEDKIAPAPVPVTPDSPTVLRTDTAMPAQYRELVDAISRNNGVDPDLIDAMMKTESNYNRWAISSKGAKGLMQLIPETGRRFGVQDFFDPRQNIEGGVRYMKFLLQMFDNNIDLSLAAYNAGENLVARLKAIPPIPETRNYVQKIRAVYTKPSANPVAFASNGGSVVAIRPAPQVSKPEAERVPEVAPISKWRDERGVLHYSNIEPPN